MLYGALALFGIIIYLVMGFITDLVMGFALIRRGTAHTFNLTIVIWMALAVPIEIYLVLQLINAS